MKPIAIIPARGGSKGIPGKNIIDLGGRPLIAHAIAVARETQAFDRIIVSTDSPQIAEVARAAGAEIPFLRPVELAGDLAPDFGVYDHALRTLQAQGAALPGLFVCLRPTSPLRTAADVLAVLKVIGETACDSVRTACPVDHHPIRMFRLEGDRPSPVLPEGHPIVPRRRQDLPAVYRWNGLAEVARTGNVLERGTLYGEDIRVVVTPRARSIDIDEPIDLAVAAALLRAEQVS